MKKVIGVSGLCSLIQPGAAMSLGSVVKLLPVIPSSSTTLIGPCL